MERSKKKREKMMKKVVRLLLFFILILSCYSYVEAKDTKVIGISCTIPVIVGLNSSEAITSASLEDKIIRRDSITQVEEREEGKRRVFLETVLIK